MIQKKRSVMVAWPSLKDNFSLIRIVNILKLMICSWSIQVNSFWYSNVLCTQYWKKVFKGRELEYIKSNITSNIEWFVSPYYLILEIEGSLNSYCSGLFIYQAYNPLPLLWYMIAIFIHLYMKSKLSTTLQKQLWSSYRE